MEPGFKDAFAARIGANLSGTDGGGFAASVLIADAVCEFKGGGLVEDEEGSAGACVAVGAARGGIGVESGDGFFGAVDEAVGSGRDFFVEEGSGFALDVEGKGGTTGEGTLLEVVFLRIIVEVCLLVFEPGVSHQYVNMTFPVINLADLKPRLR